MSRESNLVGKVRQNFKTRLGFFVLNILLPQMFWFCLCNTNINALWEGGHKTDFTSSAPTSIDNSQSNCLCTRGRLRVPAGAGVSFIKAGVQKNITVTCSHPMQDVQHRHPALSGGHCEAPEGTRHVRHCLLLVTNSRLEATKYFLLLVVAGLAPG